MSEEKEAKPKGRKTDLLGTAIVGVGILASLGLVGFWAYSTSQPVVTNLRVEILPTGHVEGIKNDGLLVFKGGDVMAIKITENRRRSCPGQLVQYIEDGVKFEIRTPLPSTNRTGPEMRFVKVPVPYYLKPGRYKYYAKVEFECPLFSQSREYKTNSISFGVVYRLDLDKSQGKSFDMVVAEQLDKVGISPEGKQTIIVQPSFEVH